MRWTLGLALAALLPLAACSTEKGDPKKGTNQQTNNSSNMGDPGKQTPSANLVSAEFELEKSP